MLARVAGKARVADAERVVGREALAVLAADVVPAAGALDLARRAAEALVALAVERDLVRRLIAHAALDVDVVVAHALRRARRHARAALPLVRDAVDEAAEHALAHDAVALARRKVAELDRRVLVKVVRQQPARRRRAPRLPAAAVSGTAGRAASQRRAARASALLTLRMCLLSCTSAGVKEREWMITSLIEPSSR